MKRLTIILTTIFAIGGTSAFAMATSNSEVQQVDLNPNTAVVDASDESNDTEEKLNSQDLNDDAGKEEEANTSNEKSGNESTDRITAEEAVAIAQGILDGKLDDVELDTEDGVLVYEVEIEYQGDDYDFKIDAHTGEVIKIDDNLLNTPVGDQVTVSLEDVKQIVNELAPSGKIDDIDLEMKNSRYVYEVEVELHGEDGDVYIDAETGEVLKIEDDLAKVLDRADSDKQTDSSSSKSDSSKGDNGEKISYEEAKEIALAHVGKGYVDDIELEHEKGLLVYEVEVEYGDDDVDVYIDAYTGEVVYVD